jgi:hypothetical protein
MDPHLATRTFADLWAGVDAVRAAVGLLVTDGIADRGSAVSP